MSARNPARWLGMIIGASVTVCLGYVVINTSPQPKLKLLSDCNGRLRTLVIQYTKDSATITETTYRQFLSALPADTRVLVCTPTQMDYDDFTRRMDKLDCEITPIVVNHPITCWSRDRWLPLQAAEKETTIYLPDHENGSETWSQREGDAMVGMDIARLQPDISATRSVLAFDGGDFAADAGTVIVTPAVYNRNAGRTVHSPEELKTKLARLLGKEVLLLERAPAHHIGMFLMPVGESRILVGDPSLGREILSANDAALPPRLITPDYTDTTQVLFDAVAKQCINSGFSVTRIPVIPDIDGRTYLSYVNTVIDEGSADRTVYVPVYKYAEFLNRAATDIWCSLGYKVIPIDCSNTYRHSGSLRCLVNVAHRTNR